MRPESHPANWPALLFIDYVPKCFNMRVFSVYPGLVAAGDCGLAVDVLTLSAKDIQALTRGVSPCLSTPKADIVNEGYLGVNCTHRPLNDTGSPSGRSDQLTPQLYDRSGRLFLGLKLGPADFFTCESKSKY